MKPHPAARYPAGPFRWHLGLTARCLPRRFIPAGSADRGSLALALPQLGPRCLQEPVPDPVGQGPSVLVCRPLEQALVFVGETDF